MNLGIIFALCTILLFGSWAVPTTTLNIHPTVKAFWLVVGHLLLSSVIFLFYFQTTPFSEIIPAFFAGVLWGIGMLLGFVAIKQLGITRAIGIWIPVVIIVSAIWGFSYFGEASTMGTDELIRSVLGIAILICATVMVVLSNKEETKLGNIKIGLLAALALGIFHGSYFIPLRTSTLPIVVTFFPLTIGMFLTVSVAIFAKRLSIKHDAKSTSKMILSGMILGAGNYTALLTIQYLGVSQGYPLTQLAIIVNTLWVKKSRH
jgi:glucose uptake protein GlcU